MIMKFWLHITTILSVQKYFFSSDSPKNAIINIYIRMFDNN